MPTKSPTPFQEWFNGCWLGAAVEWLTLTRAPCIILNSTLGLIEKWKILGSSLCCAVLYIVRAIISLFIAVFSFPLCHSSALQASWISLQYLSEIFTASVSQRKDFQMLPYLELFSLFFVSCFTLTFPRLQRALCLSHSKVQELSPRVCSPGLACLKQNQTAGVGFSREDTCHYSKGKSVFHWTLPSRCWQLHEQERLAGLTDCAILENTLNEIKFKVKLPAVNLFKRIIYRRPLVTWVFLWSLVEWTTWLFELLSWEGAAGAANLGYSLLLGCVFGEKVCTALVSRWRCTPLSPEEVHTASLNFLEASLLRAISTFVPLSSTIFS